MEQEPQAEQQEPDSSGEEEPEVSPPPFEPDPRLITYLERGRKRVAEARFRREIAKR